MKFTALLAGVSSLALMATNAAAQEEESFFLGSITVDALRTGATERAIPGTVQVIEGDDLARAVTQGGSLASVLSNAVPGLAPANGTLGDAGQTLRGRSAQILVNGISLTSELRGFSRELAVIDPSSIDRIEIVKGSTARFGNGATGGLINIVLKKPIDDNVTKIDTQLSIQDDSDSLSNTVSIAHERRFDDLALRFTLSRSETGTRYDGAGDEISSDALVGQGSLDNTESYNVGVSGVWASGAHSVEFGVGAYSLEQDIDLFPDFDVNPVGVSDREYTGEPVTDEGVNAYVTYSNDDTRFGELEISAKVSDIERRAAAAEVNGVNFLYYTDGAGTLAQDPDSQGELFTTTYELSTTFRTPMDGITSGSKLTWGVDMGRDEVEQKMLDGTDLIAPMVQNRIAAFAQLDAPLTNNIEISAGLRAERFALSVSDFTRPDAAIFGFNVLLPAVDVIGGDFNYDAVVGNIGAVYHVTETSDVYAGFSQGFSVPDVGSFTRRAGSDITIANQTISFADIRPEAQIVNTYEMGYRYTSGTTKFDAAAYFSTSGEGAVLDDTTGTVTQQAEEIWGAEIQAKSALNPNWNAGALLAYVEGRFDTDDDGETDSWLPNSRIPSSFTATLFTDYAFQNGLNLNGEIVYASGREQGDLDVLEEMVTVNVGARYPVGTGILTVGVTNLFDQYQENVTASSIRTNLLTGEAVRVADTGRTLSMGYSLTF
jgi:iron complex outermembrane receptor protein